jgi:hypothetical protein
METWNSYIIYRKLSAYENCEILRKGIIKERKDIKVNQAQLRDQLKSCHDIYTILYRYKS